MSGKSGPAGSDRSGGSGGDVWLTLGHTASMSPDERARRGLSQPEHGAEPAAAAPLSTPPTPAPEGAAIDSHPLDESSRYELEGVHARGGLGRVVRAHDRLLQRTVAIKELLQRTPAAQARFMREALITARLQHPGIVPVHEAGRWPSGDPYYSMKLVSGRTLKELIQGRAGLDERLALLPHMLAVAEAIAYAHSQGVIHRDIKPANVIVGDFGETVVVDWGLAKELSAQAPEADEADAGSLDPDTEPAATAVGHIMGTPAYMAPEQARGDGADARSDVYSLGAMLYELLAGEPPHTGDSADQILRSALTSAPVPIEERQPAAPPDLVAIVHKAMARRAGDRYRSATPLAEDIRRFQTGQLVSARHYSTRTLVRRWIARYRAVVAVAIAAAMALAAGGALWLQRVVSERNLAEARRAQAQQAAGTSNAQKNALIFLQAQSWLPRDPTAALAWLKRYPQDGPRAERLGSMVDEALDLGVARHVLRQPTWVMGVGFTGEGAGLVGVLKTGEVIRWDVGTGADRQIGRISETVKMAHVSPDGRMIAVGGAGGTVELFPLGEEAPARRLRGHDDEIRWLGFSADSRRLMTGSGDRAVRVWDLVRGGDPLLTIDREPVSSVVLAGGGDAVFIGLSSGEIARVQVEGGARRRLARLPQPAYGLTPSPDGRAVAAQLREGAIWLVDATTGAARQLGLRGGKGNWGFSPSGRYLAAATPDGTIRLHELATNAETVLRGHEDAIYHLVFSADESILLSASDDATARIWDLRTGGVRVLRGHDDDVTQAALSADGKTAATGSLDSSVRVWQLDGSAALAETVGGRIGPYVPERWSTLTNDGRMVVSFPAEDTVTLWKLDSDERAEQRFLAVDRLNPRYRHTSSSALERRARVLAVPQPGGRVAVWDLTSGARRLLGRDQGEEITALTVARDGSVLVTADAAGTVLVWNLAAGPEVEPRVLLRGRRKSRGAALSPRGDRLALALEGRLDLFDMTTGDHLASAELETSAAPSDQPRTLEFSPDGRFLASRSKAFSSLVLWNLDRGQARRIDIGGHEVIWLAFSPDSTRLALAVSDRTVRVVATATAQTRLLQGHRDLVLSVAWSRDGRVLASASYDRTVRLWDPDNGRVRVLRGHGASVESIAFSPDGTLVSTGADGMVRRWHLDRLPEERAEVVSQRLAAATTAIIVSGEPTAVERAATERAATLPSGQAAPTASGGAGSMPGAAHRPAAGWAPAR